MIAAILAVTPVFGSTLTVTNDADSGAGSLRDAIGSASNGDTIDFNLAYPATITVLFPLTLGPSVTIAGPGASSLTISGADAVGVFIVNAGAIVTISGVTIDHGSAVSGGGIFNAGVLTLSDSIVSNCTLGVQLGGGIFNRGTLTLTNTTVIGNVVTGAVGLGGGIYNLDGTLTLAGSAVSRNLAVGSGSYQGAGILNDHGSASVTNSVISGNFTSSNSVAGDALGGGIANVNSGSLVVINSTVSGNFSSGNGENSGGGGIWNGLPSAKGSIKLTNSTVSGNTAEGLGGGGGLKNLGVATLTNSTIAGNAALFGGSGGGIQNNGLTWLTNSTITRNTVARRGAGVDNSGTVSFKNSIVADNPGGNCGAGPFNFSGGYNLSDDSSCAGFFAMAGDLNATPAGLDPAGLKNNGGPTQTIALVPGSAALNAIPFLSLIECTDVNGVPITTDQRGVSRPQGSGCDIGAYEFFGSLLPIDSVGVFQVVGSVQALSLTPANRALLLVPLEGARDLIQGGAARTAIVPLQVFVDLATVMQRTETLTPQQATALIRPTEHIIENLRSVENLRSP